MNINNLKNNNDIVLSGDQDIEDVPLYKRKRVAIPLIVLAIALALTGWYWYVQRFTYVTTDDAYVESNRVSVSSKVLGRVTKLLHDEGDTVQQGDTIVKLDEADIKSQVQRTEASINYLRQNYEVATINLKKVEEDFKRTEKQFKGQIVPKEQYDHALSSLETAQAQALASQAQIGTAQADLGVLKTQLNNMVIAAPLSGVIAKRWVLSGDIVQPGQSMLAIYSVSHVWVTANYEETKLRKIKSGDRATITLDAYPGRIWNGHVSTIGAVTASQFSLIPASNASGNFTKVTQRVPVKIEFDNAGAERGASIFPGLSAVIKIIVP